MTLEQKIENAARAILQVCDEADLKIIKAQYGLVSMTKSWRLLMDRAENLSTIRLQEELDAAQVLSTQDLESAEALKSRLLESL